MPRLARASWAVPHLRSRVVADADRLDLSRLDRVSHQLHQRGDIDPTATGSGAGTGRSSLGAAGAEAFLERGGQILARPDGLGGNFVAMTPSRAPGRAHRARCSDPPPLYIAAVSNKFTSGREAASKAACSSSAFGRRHALLAGIHPLDARERVGPRSLLQSESGDLHRRLAQAGRFRHRCSRCAVELMTVVSSR